MGIDIHGLNFLSYARRHGDFGPTLTLGRQALCELDKVPGCEFSIDDLQNTYCESLLLNSFGATLVDSIDNSNFEDASIIHDLNTQIKPELHDKYQTVFDGGCLEHLFDVPQALKNIGSMLMPGGQILHVTTANNFCGHGFYQFSADFFFSVYTKANGFDYVEVWFADLTNNDHWFKVDKPLFGERVNIYSCNRIYIMVRAVKGVESKSINSVQQSDYEHLWSGGPDGDQPLHYNLNFDLSLNAECMLTKDNSIFDKVCLKFGLIRINKLTNLSNLHPFLTRYKVCDLIR